jgi:hypothetical protein
MKTALIILFLALPVAAQPSNVHVAASIELTHGSGFSGCLRGATAGADWRKGRFALSGDFDALHVKKTVGGNGWEVRGREAAKVYFGKMFIEGDLQQSHYSVTQFSKTHYFAGAGIGTWLNERALIRIAFLTHIGEVSKGTPNNQNGLETSAQFFLKHHVYFKTRMVVSRFTSPYRRTGLGTEFQIGIWK